jgi:nucleoside-diphosphate-sugar epimerase
MKIVITGAFGFLGSHLTTKFNKSGHDVLTITSKTIEPAQEIIKYKPDVIIHCAWKGGNNYKDVNSTTQIYNVTSGLELLNQVIEHYNSFRFVGFGSFAEYGDLSNIAIEDDIERPSNMYGLSKLTFKNYSQHVCKTNNIPWTWIRPCYVYGPGDVDTRLIPTVINKLLNKEDVYLDACQKIIDYIYIDDFTNYVYDIIIESAHGVYNVCSGQQYYLQNVITMIGSLLNATNYINYDYTSSRNLTSTCICGSNLKIKQLTSFAETISLAEGLQKTINFYKNKK